MHRQGAVSYTVCNREIGQVQAILKGKSNIGALEHYYTLVRKVRYT